MRLNRIDLAEMEQLRAELAAMKAQRDEAVAFLVALDAWDKRVAASFAPVLADHMRAKLDAVLAKVTP